jgi:hypothetical protein
VKDQLSYVDIGLLTFQWVGGSKLEDLQMRQKTRSLSIHGINVSTFAGTGTSSVGCKRGAGAWPLLEL